MRIRGNRAVFAVAATVTAVAGSLALAACAKPSGRATSNVTGSPTTEHVARKASTCDLASNGLAAAHALPAWDPPTACRFTDGDERPKILRGEQEIGTRLTCDGGAPSGIDFGKYALVIRWMHDFPARTGDEVVDDGATITIVRDQRAPCPHEPPGKGPDYALAFLVPTGATRTFAEHDCRVDYVCP